MGRQPFRVGAILVGDASARKIPEFVEHARRIVLSRRSTLNEERLRRFFLGWERDDGALRQAQFGQREEEGKRRFRSLV